MKNVKNYVAIVMFALVSYVAISCSNEPVYLRQENAKKVLGADYKSRISIKIPKNVVAIGDNVFRGCEYLENVKIPKNVGTIGDNAFRDCKYLENVIIPTGVRGIGTSAFVRCANLKSLEIPNSVNLSSAVFAECEKLTSVVLPAGLTYIPDYIFANCENLKTISIPGSVKRIEEKAFFGCHSLTDIKIPKNVVYIDASAFANCKSLKTVTFEDTNNWVGVKVNYNRSDYKEYYEEIEVSDPAKNVELFSGKMHYRGLTRKEQISRN